MGEEDGMGEGEISEIKQTPQWVVLKGEVRGQKEVTSGAP